MKRLFYGLLALTVLMSSCNEGEVESPKGSLSFSAKISNNANGRVQEEEVSSAIVTIESEGEVVLDNYELSMNGFESEAVLFEIGSYQITKFILLNASNEVVYATPKSGSLLANLVSTPLPQSFEVSADEVSNVELEVINTNSVDPEDLGYGTLGYNIVPTVQILVSTLVNDGTSTTFAQTDLEVKVGEDTIYSIVLGDSINVLKLRSDYSEVDFSFTLGDSLTQYKSLTSSEIIEYITTPLTITFNINASSDEGLIAYYPFSGNANDESGNGINGTLGDGQTSSLFPSLTADRNGNPNESYFFDGVDDYINLGVNGIFDIKDYDAFTFAFWVKSDLGTDGSIWSKYISASDNRMWVINNRPNSYRITLCNNGSSSLQDSVSVVKTGQWQHIAITYEAGMLKMYSNGTLEDSKQLAVNILENAPTAATVIGGVHFSNNLFDSNFTGALDEMYFYKRALSAQEINALSQ
ncbi:LamG domain-containing protein [Marinoscillum sp.]|uniref:LamG domain-containing protein n=1 Tax=Marinoscillum sp. TaxID=2024838 RepID=UPI003BA99873